MRVPQATLPTLLGAFLLLQSHSALGVVIVDEDFESYADDAAMHEIWEGLSNTTGSVSSRYARRSRNTIRTRRRSLLRMRISMETWS